MDLFVTGTLGILKVSLLDGQLKMHQANDILQKMTRSGFYSPVRRIADIV